MSDEISHSDINQAQNWLQLKPILQKELARFDTLPQIEAEVQQIRPESQ